MKHHGALLLHMRMKSPKFNFPADEEGKVSIMNNPHSILVVKLYSQAHVESSYIYFESTE